MAKPFNFSALLPWKDNPRQISPANAERLKSSMLKYGDLANITFNIRTKHLVGGHQRIKSLSLQFSAEKLSLVHRDGSLAKWDTLKANDYVFVKTPDNDKYPVRIVDWSSKKEAKANVAANSHDVTGTFDWELLSKMLQAVKDEEPESLKDFMLDDGTLEPLLKAEWDKDDGGDLDSDDFSLDDDPSPGTGSSSTVTRSIKFSKAQWKRVQASIANSGSDDEDTAEAITCLCERGAIPTKREQEFDDEE